MKCPRCETPVLEERVRDGITIDVCGQCRGIWLDRGELELLVARAREAEESWEQERYRHGDDDHHDEHSGQSKRGHYGRYDEHHGRKRRWFESLSNIFD
jgi:uncharacterized protein